RNRRSVRRRTTTKQPSRFIHRIRTIATSGRWSWMVTIKTIATGSAGNCYLIDDGRTQLLLECGITFKRIQQALDFQTSKVAACLISHSHKDHCKGVGQALKASMDVYMSQETKDEIGIEHNRIRLYENKKQFKI